MAGNSNAEDAPPGVVCAQIGARDHYAIPRALHGAGALAGLVTDFWWPADDRQSGEAKIPALRRLAGRTHHDLRYARVMSSNLATVVTEAGFRVAGTDGWERIMRRNQLFQARALRQIPWEEISRSGDTGQRPVLFAYSYAALGLLRKARELGWTTLLGQIDPGPLDSRVVERESKRWPEFRMDWHGAPAAYFDLWREELGLADRIIVNSAWSREALLAEGMSDDRIRRIPLPYDDPAAEGFPTKEYPATFTAARPLRVLFLGQVNLRKGVPALLAAMEKLAGVPVELWMVGKVKLTVPDRFKSLPNIRWMGAVSRGEVGNLYQQADVFLFPTHSDGFGLTQLEAQAWRLPVIASKHCGEVVVDGENGMVLDEVTAESIRDALIRCFENPQLLEKWSAGSGIAPPFRLKATGEAILEVIREARGSGGKPGDVDQM